MYGAFCSTRIK